MDPQVIIFGASSLVLGSVVGFLLGRFTSGAILYLLWVVLIVGNAILLIPQLGALFGLAQEGWSRLGYVILSMIFVSPALAGSLIAGWVGLRLRRRHRQSAVEQNAD